MNLALLGTGLLGSPMAEQLIKSGYELTVYNRTIEKTEPLRKLGAAVAKTPQGAIESAECSILILADASAIEETLFSDGEKIDFNKRTIIQMGTILPLESLEFQKKISSAGGDYLEAPVLGSVPQAKDRKLIVMVGASRSQFEQRQEIFKYLGEKVYLAGEVGKAAALKLALNQLIASLTAAFSLSLGIVQRNNIDVDLFMEIVRNSAVFSPTFEKKLPRMMKRDFSNPNFPTKHLLKDVNLILNESERLGLATPLVEAIIGIIRTALEKGNVETDYSSIYNAINPAY